MTQQDIIDEAYKAIPEFIITLDAGPVDRNTVDRDKWIYKKECEWAFDKTVARGINPESVGWLNSYAWKRLDKLLHLQALKVKTGQWFTDADAIELKELQEALTTAKL
jgi:hypothetical protein